MKKIFTLLLFLPLFASAQIRTYEVGDTAYYNNIHAIVDSCLERSQYFEAIYDLDHPTKVVVIAKKDIVSSKYLSQYTIQFVPEDEYDRPYILETSTYNLFDDCNSALESVSSVVDEFIIKQNGCKEVK